MQDAMLSTPSYQQIQELQPVHGQYLLILQHDHSPEAQHLADQFAACSILLASSDTFSDELKDQLQQAHAGVHAVVCGDEIFLCTPASVGVEGALAETLEEERSFY